MVADFRSGFRLEASLWPERSRFRGMRGYSREGLVIASLAGASYRTRAVRGHVRKCPVFAGSGVLPDARGRWPEMAAFGRPREYLPRSFCRPIRALTDSLPVFAASGAGVEARGRGPRVPRDSGKQARRCAEVEAPLEQDWRVSRQRAKRQAQSVRGTKRQYEWPEMAGFGRRGKGVASSDTGHAAAMARSLTLGVLMTLGASRADCRGAGSCRCDRSHVWRSS
jgi:hypothetical protein